MDDRAQWLIRGRQVIDAEATAVAAAAGALDESFVQAVELLLKCPGHVLTTGIGTSHAVALRLAHLLSCVGTPALFIHPADSLHGSAGAVRPGDVVFAISKGGESAEVNEFVEIAVRRGAHVVAVTENRGSHLGSMADVVLKVSSPPEIDQFSGMVSTGSSLVNSAVLDALCDVLLAARGYSAESFIATHPGGMVGVRIREGLVQGGSEEVRLR